MIRKIALIALASLLTQSCSDNSGPQSSARALSYDVLIHGVGLPRAVPLSEFTPPDNALAPSNRFSGRLRIKPETQDHFFRLLVDELDLVALNIPGMGQLPALDVDFVQGHGHLIPLVRTPIQSDHDWWEFILEPGPVWDQPDDHGYTRAAIPFSLKERNGDCIHNGLFSFLFNDQGEVSQLAFQITHQTCKYLQFELRALLAADYQQSKIATENAVVAAFDAEVKNRMVQRPIAMLAVDYPGTDVAKFGSVDEIKAKDMSVYGLVIDGIHYVGGCATSLGEYPYCDEMALPSYSLAKSLVGGLGLMRAEQLYPGLSDALISDYVPECSDWDGVTMRHALNMATGRYKSAAAMVDEDAAIVSDFFIAEDHAAKINAACRLYPKKSEPGTRWVYHTSDIYLVGVALNGLLRERAGPGADFYTDLIVEDLWKPLKLSPLMHGTRRTRDPIAQPFTAWGLSLHRDDIAKIAAFLGPADGQLDGVEVLDRPMFDAIKQRIPGDGGLAAGSDKLRYINGFRSYDVTQLLQCEKQTWVTTMSGYGGIVLVLMPNDTAYYYFSDGGVFWYHQAVQESHRIRPMCD